MLFDSIMAEPQKNNHFIILYLHDNLIANPLLKVFLKSSLLIMGISLIKAIPVIVLDVKIEKEIIVGDYESLNIFHYKWPK